MKGQEVVVAGQDNSLQRVETEKMMRALAKAAEALKTASTMQEAMKVRDIGSAVEIYARQKRLSESTIKQAHLIFVDATAKMGEFLEQERRSVNYDLKKVSVIFKAYGVLPRESRISTYVFKLRSLDPNLFERFRLGEVPLSNVIKTPGLSRFTHDQSLVSLSQKEMLVKAAVELAQSQKRLGYLVEILMPAPERVVIDIRKSLVIIEESVRHLRHRVDKILNEAIFLSPDAVDATKKERRRQGRKECEKRRSKESKQARVERRRRARLLKRGYHET